MNRIRCVFFSVYKLLLSNIIHCNGFCAATHNIVCIENVFVVEMFKAIFLFHYCYDFYQISIQSNICIFDFFFRSTRNLILLVRVQCITVVQLSWAFTVVVFFHVVQSSIAFNFWISSKWQATFSFSNFFSSYACHYGAGNGLSQYLLLFSNGIFVYFPFFFAHFMYSRLDICIRKNRFCALNSCWVCELKIFIHSYISHTHRPAKTNNWSIWIAVMTNQLEKFLSVSKLKPKLMTTISLEWMFHNS